MNAERSRLRGRRWFLAVFAAVGFGIAGMLFGWPTFRWAQAQSWERVPCEVESSEVRRHQARGSRASYSIAIQYRYHFKGSDYSSDQYDIWNQPGQGVSRMRSVVLQHPVGWRGFCHVNPAKPEQAVLSLEFPKQAWPGLLPALLGVAGLVGFVAAGRKPEASLGGGMGTQPPVSSPVTRRTPKRAGAFVFLITFCLAWNLTVFLISSQLIREYQAGRAPLFVLAFLLPFLIAGIVMFVLAFREAGSLFGPRPVLTLDPGDLIAGRSVFLRWSFEGPAYRIQKLVVALEGFEYVRYRQGKTTREDESVFRRIVVYEGSERSAISGGESRVDLPRDLIPTFGEASNMGCRWRVRITAEVRGLPDLKQDFDARVLPSTEGSGGEAGMSGKAEEVTASSGRLKLGIRNGKAPHSPGSFVHGAVGWSLDSVPTRAEVRLVLRLESEWDDRVFPQATLALPSPKAQEARTFEIQIPTSVLPSYQGKYIRASWQVQLAVEPGGGFAHSEILVA
ncbi:MAG: DUF3592 domain-containing protein [Verrucomicrobia bacterium]|nr:DUF3592 domain-containing protein [Verrucomicrobiota bacterium]